MDDYTIVVKHFDPADPRLGRHVVHDSRSLRYLAPRKALGQLRSVRHWIEVPIMDQGQIGSCTGHAGTANMGGPAFWPAGREAISIVSANAHAYAEQLYSDATALDPWPGAWRPDDTGSDGLSIAKVLKSRGLISGYQHATSLEAALTALDKQPVIVGTNWLEGMYYVGADGRTNVTGAVAGGHEYCLDELDVENKRVWMRNSWGLDWGLSGRAWMSWDDLGRLLADSGDCTVLVPREEPTPTPAPVPPPPPPAPPSPPPPTPAPTPAPTAPDASAALRTALLKFTRGRACPRYLYKAAEAWLKVSSTVKRSST